jgi:two-component system sensor histidine kinase NreB
MITVRLDQSDHKLTLIVEDDGQGFIPDSQSSPPTDSPDRLGIQGMQERASLIGGQLEITTQEGQGTTLQLTVLV